MADYIYLLQHRLSSAQQVALHRIREVAREHALTVFLVGGAVRDLTSGSPVRDLDVAVQGNALKLRKALELSGAKMMGEIAVFQALFMSFAGEVRVEIGSTLSVTYPKPGKPVIEAATIQDDLRRRDFTANAMALSLNEGSYGLLMDPLNGVADIENRELRLVSNYGFIEDPVRMIRAARFMARLGWTMDEKTQTRYETGKSEKYIGALSALHRGYEAEEIFHEEDPLRVLRKLEEEGWMKHLFPPMTVAKANTAELEKLREMQTQLQVAGINPDAAAANFPLLTAKLSPTELAELKKSFVRQGFVAEIENLEAEAKEFATQLAGKSAALPSQAWTLIHAAKPEAVLWAAYSSKSPTVQAKLKSFHTEWPKARQKVPFTLMQEMRIVPELENFDEVVEKVFFELMDGKLTTTEEQKAFLESYSPPAPPPPVNLRRSRAGKKDGKGAKSKKKAAASVDLDEDIEHDEQSGRLADDDENEGVELPDEMEDETTDEMPESDPLDTEEAEVQEISEPEKAVEAEPIVEPASAPMAEPKTASIETEAAVTAVRTKAELPAKKTLKMMTEAGAPPAAGVPSDVSKEKPVAGKAPAEKSTAMPELLEPGESIEVKTSPRKMAAKKVEGKPVAKVPEPTVKQAAKAVVKTAGSTKAAPAEVLKQAAKKETPKAATEPKQTASNVSLKIADKKKR